MRMIYHLVTPRAWKENADQPYRAESLANEGFIHCSFAEQVERSANRFYADAAELVLLHIDADRLSSPLREEASGTGEIFPHIHGPLNRDAVAEVEVLPRGPDGRWQFKRS
jgi:uncharacterized protein (DUF952 family)